MNMISTCIWKQLLVVIYLSIGITSGQICMFYHLSADCKYKIDASTVNIQANINKCNDPVDVTFKIQCDDPQLNWQHTFTQMEESADIPGFDMEVVLAVKQGFRDGDIYTVDADFDIEEQPRTDFLHQELNLVPDGSCNMLTNESIIAIAVLVPVFVLASAALIAVLVMWRKSVKQAKLQNNSLVCNGVMPDQSDPPVTFRNGRIDMTIVNNQTLDTEMQPDFSTIPGYEENLRY